MAKKPHLSFSRIYTRDSVIRYTLCDVTCDYSPDSESQALAD